MKIKLRKISFYTAWPLRFYYEYDMSSTRTAYISSLVCPNIDDYLSLVANRGFWYKETYRWQDKGARDHWLFCPQNTQFGVLGRAQFGSRTPIVSSKLRYKRDSSFILEDQCTYPSSLITTPIFVRKRLRALHSTTAEISRTL